MKYLFDMGEVWHVYADMGNQWIYYRMEQVAEESIDKNGADLPGPLGRLELFAQLEKQLEAEQAHAKLQESLRKQATAEYEQARQEFEKSYKELQKMAEELQAEGRMWRQRYLDLAYQVSPKGK